MPWFFPIRHDLHSIRSLPLKGKILLQNLMEWLCLSCWRTCVTQFVVLFVKRSEFNCGCNVRRDKVNLPFYAGCFKYMQAKINRKYCHFAQLRPRHWNVCRGKANKTFDSCSARIAAPGSCRFGVGVRVNEAPWKWFYGVSSDRQYEPYWFTKSPKYVFLWISFDAVVHSLPRLISTMWMMWFSSIDWSSHMAQEPTF